MSDWHKVEKKVESPSKHPDKTEQLMKDLEASPYHTRKRRSDAGKKRETSETKVSVPSPSLQIPSAPLPATDTHSSLRYTAGGRRRGRYHFAAPLGLLVLTLSVVGLISLVVLGIHGIRRAQDDTPLRNEMNDFLSPIMQYNPEAFSNINETKQDALLLSAIWKVTDAERIREKKENTSVSKYQMDDMGRMLIPVSEVEESYVSLYGPDAVPNHHNIGDEGLSFTIEYDKDQGYYHVPFISTPSTYVPVIDTLKQKGDTVVVRVGYVLSTKIGIDDKGNPLDPTADMADYFQKYTVKRVDKTGWMLVSIADEKSSTTASSTVNANGETPDSAVSESGVDENTGNTIPGNANNAVIGNTN